MTPENNNSTPVRRRLFHERPPWITGESIYFITINCARRGPNQLALPAIADKFQESFLHYQNENKIWMHFLLLMPDHVHMLISFGRETIMAKFIGNWKKYLARFAGIEWQIGFFDHRIRNDDELKEKWQYVWHNPVRAGLVADPSEWPYQWHHGRSERGRPKEWDC